MLFGAQAQVADLRAIVLGVMNRLNDRCGGAAAVLSAQRLHRHDLHMTALRQSGNSLSVARIRCNCARAMGAVAVIAAGVYPIAAVIKIPAVYVVYTERMMGLWGKESTYTKLLQRISEKNA